MVALIFSKGKEKCFLDDIIVFENIILKQYKVKPGHDDKYHFNEFYIKLIKYGQLFLISLYTFINNNDI